MGQDSTLKNQSETLLKIPIKNLDGGVGEHRQEPISITLFHFRSTSVEVRVKIQRVNDNSPQFQTSTYQFRVQENSPDQTMIGTVIVSTL